MNHVSEVASASSLVIGTAFLGCVALIVFCALYALIFAGTKKAPPTDQPDLTTVIEPHATIVDPTHSWSKLEPTGREVFFPKLPHDSYIVYELTLTGTLWRDGHRADAFYRTDANGNFTWGMDWLRIGGSDLKHRGCDFVESDRAEHRYRIRFSYAGRLTLALEDSRHHKWHGGILAELCALPPGTMTSRQCMELQREQAKEKRIADQARQEATAEARKFAQIVQTLSIRAELNRNWRDPQYREKFARAYSAELIRSQGEIRQQAEELLQQARLVSYLQRHAPTVMPTLLGRLESLLIAENLALDKALVPRVEVRPKAKALEERPKRKRTSKEVTELKVRHQQIHLGDKVALALDKVATIENVKSQVRNKYGHLEEDEQQRIIQEVLDQIHEEENQHAKTL